MNHARAREKGAEHRQQKGESDERDVPVFEQSAPSLQHDGMQKRSCAQPRHQARVFHRIPRPVTAPAERFIRPHAAQHNANREHNPGEQNPAPNQRHPHFIEFAVKQRGDGKRKRNSATDVADVKRWRMNLHPVVLE